jgi:hypothetical protein
MIAGIMTNYGVILKPTQAESIGSTATAQE